MRVIGFDPGLSATGFGIIESDEKNNVYHIDNGVLRPPRKMLLPDRLNYLYKKIVVSHLMQSKCVWFDRINIMLPRLIRIVIDFFA